MKRTKIAANLKAVVHADTDDFVALMKLAELDPKSDLRYSNLSETDFGEADVTEWDFSGARLDEANLSNVRNIEKAVFCQETTLINVRLPEGLTVSDLVN